jgi:hypothetical protein
LCLQLLAVWAGDLGSSFTAAGPQWQPGNDVRWSNQLGNIGMMREVLTSISATPLLLPVHVASLSDQTRADELLLLIAELAHL